MCMVDDLCGKRVSVRGMWVGATQQAGWVKGRGWFVGRVGVHGYGHTGSRLIGCVETRRN